MRHDATMWAPHDRGRPGGRPPADAGREPGPSELDPVGSVREAHLSLPDLDASGHSFMGDAAALMDVDWADDDEPAADEA